MSKYKALKGVMVFSLSIILIHLYNIEWNFIELRKEVFKCTINVKEDQQILFKYALFTFERKCFQGHNTSLTELLLFSIGFYREFLLRITCCIINLLPYNAWNDFFTSYGFSFFQILGDHVINLLLNLLLPFKLNFLERL